jgi:hypothetical protein
MIVHQKQPPEVICPDGIAKMREAVRVAAQAVNSTSEGGKLELASIIFHYYSQGLSDPQRLADIAASSTSSRSLRSPPPCTPPR